MPQYNAYLRLMRFDSPTGFFLLLWPCWWSIGFASSESNIDFPLYYYFIFLVGTIVMRSAGCIINDIIDRKIDQKVERTKNRPLASGEIKLYEAILIAFILLSIGAAILLSMNDTVLMMGYIVIVPIFVYPLMKRITYWPQAFLALTFNWGALMGWAAITNEINPIGVIIYIACIFWTLGYDTIYSHQDKEHDALLGVKSTALKLGKYTKKYLYVFYSTTIICLWFAGVLVNKGIFYHIFLLIAAFQLFWQINSVDFNNAESCMAKFKSNRYFGAIIFIGILAGMWKF